MLPQLSEVTVGLAEKLCIVIRLPASGRQFHAVVTEPIRSLPHVKALTSKSSAGCQYICLGYGATGTSIGIVASERQRKSGLSRLVDCQGGKMKIELASRGAGALGGNRIGSRAASSMRLSAMRPDPRVFCRIDRPAKKGLPAQPSDISSD